MQNIDQQEIASSVGVRGLAYANVYREPWGGGPVVMSKGGFFNLHKPKWCEVGWGYIVVVISRSLTCASMV